MQYTTPASHYKSYNALNGLLGGGWNNKLPIDGAAACIENPCVLCEKETLGGIVNTPTATELPRDSRESLIIARHGESGKIDDR
ncbi:hypothetical protein TNIN_111831 [Trichonephila inaurata madagascariensis]|uniref:Uncharacterized protein n=1 Tax=Trichonephila inaurata madagascariensis TaxID=2747483 RepID=A0A8X7CLE3_9ARAC|nr:hypothetical protein TNIN_111831 [Trichonephila inaurata madagascariensis]